MGMILKTGVWVTVGILNGETPSPFYLGTQIQAASSKSISLEQTFLGKLTSERKKLTIAPHT